MDIVTFPVLTTAPVPIVGYEGLVANVTMSPGGPSCGLGEYLAAQVFGPARRDRDDADLVRTARR